MEVGDDVLIGRVYSYDFSVKLLFLSKSYFLSSNYLPCLTEIVSNPGTAEEKFANLATVNSRNIKSIELLEDDGQPTSDKYNPSSDEFVHEFAIGD
jgi:hypothetical protein